MERNKARTFGRAAGFTLIELLIVIAIMGLLATLAVTALGRARGRSRDTARKANLTQIQKALELYFHDNGRYPSTNGAWWGDMPAYGNRCHVDGCGGSGPYIVGLAPKYVPKLPEELFPHGVAVAPCNNNVNLSGYLYRSNGTDYKFLSYCAADNGIISSDPMKDPRRPAFAWAVGSPAGMAW